MQYIGIDIGTSSICGVLYDEQTKQNQFVTRKNDASLPSRFDGEKIQDPNRLMSIVNSILDDFLAICPDPAGIGITGQMHGILYYDKNGQAVSPLFTWQDGRGNIPDSDGRTLADDLTKKTGRFVASGFGLVTHYYNVIHKIVPDDAIGLCTIMDYAVMQLTGRKRAVIESSNAASLGFFDPEKEAFDPVALSAIKMDPSFLPELWSKNSSPYYGAALAKRIDSKNLIPVMPAIGDNQAAFIGAVFSKSSHEERRKDLSEAVHVTIGTSSQIAVYSSQFITVPDLETRPFPGGGYLLVGAALCGGSSLAILKTFFEKTLNMFLPNVCLSESDIYRIMTNGDIQKYNRQNDIANCLLVETCFAGTRQDPTKRGVIRNITTDNFVPEELIGGFLNGMAEELYEFWQRLPVTLRQNRRFIAGSGNAIRKNALLRRIFEDKFALPLKLSICNEEAALGVAKIASVIGGQHK